MEHCRLPPALSPAQRNDQASRGPSHTTRKASRGRHGDVTISQNSCQRNEQGTGILQHTTQSVRTILPSMDYGSYVAAWEQVALAGQGELNLDTWAGGRRYLSLATLCLTPAEAAQLRNVTVWFSRLV